tara:strand:+ start:610 stop:810 length:201 start_codon:yes stop_codon:yes gene_type:complete
MSWFCQTPEAQEQLRICEENNCPDCEKCIWISESYNAMTEYGTVSKGKPHPLKEQIIEKFNGVEIS